MKQVNVLHTHTHTHTHTMTQREKINYLSGRKFSTNNSWIGPAVVAWRQSVRFAFSWKPITSASVDRFLVGTFIWYRLFICNGPALNVMDCDMYMCKLKGYACHRDIRCKLNCIIFWACLIQAWLPEVKQSKVARYDMHNMCVHNVHLHNVFTINAKRGEHAPIFSIWS